MESAAPLRILSDFISTPLILVVAVNGTKLTRNSSRLRSLIPNFSFAKITTLRPSGVSSARDANCAASANSCSV